MKIINIIGGLGNQMFCYAFALALKYKYKKEDVLVDISHFGSYKLHDGFLINKIFDVKEIKIADKKAIKKLSRYVPHYKLSRVIRKFFPQKKTEYLEKNDYLFDLEALNKTESLYYEGYWQSPLYFNDIRDLILKMFTFPEADETNKKIEKHINNVNSVSVHVRRGDYINHETFAGICDEEYYKNAIDLIKKQTENPYYFIFSNDINWCKQNLTPYLDSENVVFISNNQGSQSYWDMYLMSCCKNMIIANSSFSWWAAYLNKNDAALIISPKKWVNGSFKTEIHLSNWTKI